MDFYASIKVNSIQLHGKLLPSSLSPQTWYVILRPYPSEEIMKSYKLWYCGIFLFNIKQHSYADDIRHHFTSPGDYEPIQVLCHNFLHLNILFLFIYLYKPNTSSYIWTKGGTITLPTATVMQYIQIFKTVFHKRGGWWGRQWFVFDKL